MSQSESIRVLIADDHPMVRKGLIAFLDVLDELEFAGEAKDGREALCLCEEAQPDVVLMDVVMPNLDGPGATRQIRDRWPQIQVIAITSFEDEELVHQALQAGAIGYLLKDVTAEELEKAIHAAYEGRPTLSPSATQALIHSATQESSDIQDLSPRENEVLALMVEGMSNREIAVRLSISPATVSVHVSSILSKLGVANRVEATALAIRENLLG